MPASADDSTRIRRDALIAVVSLATLISGFGVLLQRWAGGNELGT